MDEMSVGCRRKVYLVLKQLCRKTLNEAIIPTACDSKGSHHDRV